MSERRSEPGGRPKPSEFEGDLEPGIERDERGELLSLAASLSENRPVPPPRLRSAVRSKLLRPDSATASSRVGAMVFGYAASGALLLVVAAAGLVGIGPFAA